MDAQVSLRYLGFMPRYALKIEYDGGPFAGWQRQAQGQKSVQGAVEAALARLEPRAHTIAAAGRTDAGVHATGQVAHCDLERDWDPFRLTEALNFHLKPAPVAVVQVARVPDDFHARFSAVERRYTFRLVSRRAPVVHDRGLVWQVLNRLDLVAMQAGAAYLVGHHDFTTFRSSICQAKSPVKTIDEIRIEELPYHRPILAYDCVFNRHTLRDGGAYFADQQQLVQQLRVQDVREWVPLAAELHAGCYCWLNVARAYESLCLMNPP